MDDCDDSNIEIEYTFLLSDSTDQVSLSLFFLLVLSFLQSRMHDRSRIVAMYKGDNEGESEDGDILFLLRAVTAGHDKTYVTVGQDMQGRTKYRNVLHED